MGVPSQKQIQRAGLLHHLGLQLEGLHDHGYQEECFLSMGLNFTQPHQ